MSPLTFGCSRFVRGTYDNASGGWLGAAGSGNTPGVVTPPETVYGSNTYIGDAVEFGRYFVFEYQFFNGSDLDTRTGFIYPYVADGDALKYEGWGKTGNDFLYWAGDNTSSSGYESCYIDKQQVLTAYPGITYIEIDTRAMWYTTYGSNGILIKMTAYTGGAMVKSGFEWTNPTATLTYPAAFSYAKNITTVSNSSSNNGQRVAKIKLDFSLRSLNYYTID